MADSILLGAEEIREITGGYARQADQLRVLHQRGFWRAAILRGHLVLERSHYDAVTRATLPGQAERARPMLKSDRIRERA